MAETGAAQTIYCPAFPENRRSVFMGYLFVGAATAAQDAALIRELALPNLRLMFDCYHLQIMEGDITRRLAALLPLIGHIQIAAHVLRHIAGLG
jgi:hydroxypyruvate isomerase